jgi:hypothetical protein
VSFAIDLHLLAPDEFKELQEKILRSPKMTERPKRIDPRTQNWNRAVIGMRGRARVTPNLKLET